MTIALLLLACRFEPAPVNDDYRQSFEEQARTSMGARTTYTATVMGTTAFGEHVAFGRTLSARQGRRRALLVTEAHPDAVCDRRLRKIALHPNRDDHIGDVIDCTDPDQVTFGTTLHAADFKFVTGDHIGLFSEADAGRISSSAPGADQGMALHMPSEWHAVAGVPGANQVHLLRAGSSSEGFSNNGTVDGPRGVQGFGTAVFGGEQVIGVADANGHPSFYEVVDGDDWRSPDTLLPIANPSALRILASHGNEFLVERGGDPDLHIVRWDDGVWTDASRLVDAAGWYDDWVFDGVAAFGASPRGPGHRGVVDRYERLTGTIDASLTLVRPHERVSLLLDDGWLAVSEYAADATSAIHVLDWRDDRERMYWTLGDNDYSVCLVPEANDRENAHAMEEVGEGRYAVWGDATFDSVYYRVPMREDQTATVRMIGMDEGDWLGDVGVELLPEEGWGRDARRDGDALTATWHAGDWSDLYLEVRAWRLSGDDEDLACVPYQLFVEVEDDPEFCADTVQAISDWWSETSTIPLLDADGVEQGALDEEHDRYSVDLIAGQTLAVDVTRLDDDHRIHADLMDLNGNVLDSYRSWSSTVTYTAVADETVELEVRGGLTAGCVGYLLDVDLTGPADVD